MIHDRSSSTEKLKKNAHWMTSMPQMSYRAGISFSNTTNIKLLPFRQGKFQLISGQIRRSICLNLTEQSHKPITAHEPRTKWIHFRKLINVIFWQKKALFTDAMVNVAIT